LLANEARDFFKNKISTYLLKATDVNIVDANGSSNKLIEFRNVGNRMPTISLLLEALTPKMSLENFDSERFYFYANNILLFFFFFLNFD
jgi:hypothetical protein